MQVDPKPGDLIEIAGDRVCHWAVYVGDGYIIHLVPLGQTCCGSCKREREGEWVRFCSGFFQNFILFVSMKLVVQPGRQPCSGLRSSQQLSNQGSS